MDTTINGPDGAWDPYIAPNASYLIFSSEHVGGPGSVEQYISRRQADGSWSTPVGLDAVNTDRLEYGSYVGYDSRYYSILFLLQV